MSISRPPPRRNLCRDDRQALAWVLLGFLGLGSFGYSVFIHSGQALAMLEHPGLLLGLALCSSFLLGFLGYLVPVGTVLVYHLISYEPRIKSRSPWKADSLS